MKVAINRYDTGDFSSKARLDLLNGLMGSLRVLGNYNAPGFSMERLPDGDYMFAEYSEVPTDGSIITLFGMYYSLDSGWFYATNPREVSGIPVISFSLILADLGITTPKNLSDLIIHYKLTGKLDEFAEALFDQSDAVVIPIVRYLLQTGGRVVLGSSGELLRSLITTFRNMTSLSRTLLGGSGRKDYEDPNMVRWLNMRSTIQNRSMSVSSVLPVDVVYGSMRKELESDLYLSCCPGYTTPAALNFTDMKALNSYDVVRAEHLSRDDLIYFDALDISAEGLHAFTLVDGRERNAAIKAIKKYSMGRTYRGIDQSRADSAMSPKVDGNSQITVELVVLMKGFNIIRSVGQRVLAIR